MCSGNIRKMMTGAPQHIEIFVTHVAEEGPLLKIWGQLDRSAATFVERLILQFTEQFDRGIGVVYPQSLSADQLCCAKYGEDGVYYRARIADLSGLQQGYVRVNFIDYGNSDLIDISNIRSLQVNASSPLCSIQSQATEFALAGVVPPMGGNWDQATVDFVREKLCYAEFRCAIVAQLSGRKLITLYYHDTDFSEILIQKSLAIRITLHAQQNMFHNMQYQFSSTPSYNFSVPPPPVHTSYSNNANLLAKTTSITKQETGVISAPILSVGSKHAIYISYVEDGPYLFAVQLKTTESILQNMTQTFSHVQLKPFSQSPIPGSACVSLLPQAKVMCRAVVTNIMEKECVVYCVDFGNTETVPFSQIFEMPSQFLHTKSLAMRFCLAGIQNTSFDEKAKRLFQDLVTGETLTLEVVEPEGPPLKQYGNIYLNGENIVNVLKTKMKDQEKSKAYPQLPTLQPGRVVSVIVSYVESVDNFFVQYDANAKALSKIMSTMLQYCTNSAALIRPNELYIGMPVCALFSADMQWYRARVVSVAGDLISVFYVDYGNTDTVNLMSLRQMDPNLSQAQVQAVACCLSGFEGSGVPLEDLSNKLEELTLERKLTMKILSRLTNGKFVVELHDTTVVPIVNVGLQLLAPPKPTYEETPIDEWRDPASGEPATPSASSSQFGKERSKQEDGGGEGWRTDSKKSSGWNESRDSSKKWGNWDDKNRNEKKWNRDDQSGEQKRWGKEEQEGSSGWGDREEAGGHKRWESSDSRSNNDKSRDRRGFNKDNSDWKERENKRGFNRDEEDWKDNNKRGFVKGSDDWKEKDTNRKGFNRDGDDWKSRDNNRRFNKDGEDRNWRKRDDQGQEEKKWWGHDDRGEPEKKWGSDDRQDNKKKWGSDDRQDNKKKWGSGNDRQDNEKKWGAKDDDEEPRKWGGRDNKRTSNTGEFKKWNDGEKGNRRNFGKEDSFKGAASSSEDNWGSNNVVASNDGGEDWDTGSAVEKIKRSDANKVYNDAAITFGTKENVVLVFADDPSSFVLQLNNKMDDLAKMMENIASVYESGGSAISDEDQKVLSPCVARYSEDNSWYRAVVTNVPNGGVTEVRFVDYGNHESVSSSDVKEVVPEFLSIPLFGIPCSLFAVQVPVAEWSSDQVTEFLNLADGKELEVHFIQKEGPLFEVVLFDVEQPSSSINEKFGASNASIQEGMSMKKIKSTPQLSTSFIKPMPEVVYASPDDCFMVSNITPEMTDTVSVTWFISPDQFYCQCHSKQTEIASMVNDIQKAYKGRKSFKGDLAVGLPVIAQFPSDKVLYRAEIKEITGMKYLVQYVDYGNMEILASSNIWQIEKKFLELPKQAIECCVSGIKPAESEWPKDSSDFDRLFGAESLECVFHDAKDGKNLVSLTVNGKDVAEELVACGLAVRKVEERVLSEERLALKLLKRQQIPAHVSFIESLSKFFVHLDPVVAKSIQEKVDKYVLENKTVALADMVEHQMCLASPDGSQWYRGKIIDTSGTVGVCVSFVDFGDSDDIPVERIRPIPEELMGLRHQATECFVIGSDTSEVNKEVEENFKVEVEAQDVILSIEDIVNGRLSVHLFDIEGGRLEILKNIDKSAPLDVEPLCPMPILTHTLHMWVSHVDNLNEIWFQKESESDTLNGLLELLFNFYEEESKGIELGDPEAGQLCAAKSTKDGSWYRAKVKDITAEEICVTYIDYGNSETLPKDDVKELDPSFYRVHALATCASLAATVLEPEAALTEFEKITTETVFDVSFVKDSEGKWFAHLENDDTNVIHLLMKSNSVSEIKLLFQSEQVSLPTNEKIDVSISHFESCAEFWVQMDSNFLDILELQQTLQSVGSNQAALTETDVGTLCIAQFSDDAWYRAKILEINGLNAKVHFLDYGNAFEADANSLKKLPMKFFRWPYFAVRCCLADKTFLENVELSEKCSEILSDSDTVFQLQVVEDNDPVLVSLFVGENELEKAIIERKETKGPEASASAIDNTESPAALSETTTETVFVSHISSPAKFWIQRDSASLELQDLADALAQAVDFEAVSGAQEGNICAALFEDDEQWYRAKVLEVCEDGYKVLFVDYGNSTIVSDIRVLPEELLNKPIVGKCCRLHMPAGVECWSSEADKKFVELSGEGSETFEMIMLSSEEPFEVKLFYNGNDMSNMLSELCVPCSKAPSDGEFTATIAHINHPGEFWVQWEIDSSKLELINDKLVEAENFDPVEEYSDGLLCIAQFPDDEQWYRSRIISCQELNIEVFFIDYGNTASVSEVHSIPQDLACIPALAKRCALPLPSGLEKWPGKAEEEFINIFGDGSNTFKITVVQEGDPSIINLELNGSQVVDLLEKCCTGSVEEKLNSSDEVSCSSSSTEVEILSETEVVIDPTDPLKVEQELCEEESIVKSESEIANETCEVAKEILNEMLENTVSADGESKPENEMEISIIDESGKSCEEKQDNEMEILIIDESGKSCEEKQDNEMEISIIDESGKSCEEKQDNEMEISIIDESGKSCEEKQDNEMEISIIDESGKSCEEKQDNEMENLNVSESEISIEDHETNIQEEKETLADIDSNESSAIVSFVLDELIGTKPIEHDSVSSREELKEEISVLNESPCIHSDELIPTSASEGSTVIEQVDSHGEGTSSSSELQENPCDQKTENNTSLKKNEIIPLGKHSVEHCEQIIKDFSVSVKMPPALSKNASSDASQGSSETWNSSPARKIPHAERIVPGSISRDHSIDLGDSPDGKENELEKSSEDNVINISESSDKNLSDDEILKCGNGDRTCLETDQAISEQQKNHDFVGENDGIISDSHNLEKTPQGADKCLGSEQGEASSLNISSDKDEAAGSDDESSNTRSSMVLNDNESSSLSGSLLKVDDHDTSGSTINDNSTHPLDSSESNSTSVASSSSPQKDSRSTELESEMSGDVSGSLYEDSDSSTNSTLISNSMAGSSKHVGIDEDKMKYYEFAQMHTNEESFESSKSGLKSSATNDVETKTVKAAQTKPDTLLAEEKED